MREGARELAGRERGREGETVVGVEEEAACPVTSCHRVLNCAFFLRFAKLAKIYFP